MTMESWEMRVAKVEGRVPSPGRTLWCMHSLCVYIGEIADPNRCGPCLRSVPDPRAFPEAKRLVGRGDTGKAPSV